MFTAAFKEICPAGPGYHYSASAVKINQRVADIVDSSRTNVRTSTQDKQTQPESSRTNSQSTRTQQTTNTHTIRVQQPSISQSSRPQQPDTGSVIIITQPKLNQPTAGRTTNIHVGNSPSSTSQPSRVNTREPFSLSYLLKHVGRL